MRRLQIRASLAKPVRQSDLLQAIERALSSPGDPVEATSARAGGNGHAAGNGGTPRVLLAEDNRVNRLLATRMLERAGYTVTAATTGREVLDLVASHDFDVILMDVQMPEMDGFDATRAIRAGEAAGRRRHPIIAMTAHAMKGDRERCLSAGMDGYVAKPVRADQLLAAIDEVLASPRGTSSPAACN
jgi:protein-histidine pros-kinase